MKEKIEKEMERVLSLMVSTNEPGQLQTYAAVLDSLTVTLGRLS